MKHAFTDIESTGLRSHPGAEAWEIATIVRESHDPGGVEEIRAGDRENLWWVRPVRLSWADPVALRISRFYERTDGAADSREAVNLAEPANQGRRVFSDPAAVAAVLAPLLAGSLIIGQNPWFDADLTDEFLRRNGQALAADFHLRDLSSMATGYFCATGVRPADMGADPLNGTRLTPPSLRKLAVSLGIDLAPYNPVMHTALPDARLARDAHDTITDLYLANLRLPGTMPSPN